MLKELYEFKDVYHKIEKWKTENIRYLFFLLLCEKKVSFKELSDSYVEYLEVDNKDKLKQLIEAETCVLENLVVTYEDIILTTTDDELLFNTIDKIKKSEPNKDRSSDIYIVYGFDIMEHSNLDTPTNIKDYIIYSFDNTYKK